MHPFHPANMFPLPMRRIIVVLYSGVHTVVQMLECDGFDLMRGERKGCGCVSGSSRLCV